MSLVFLKSQNNETTRTSNPHSPSRFSNYFTQPLHLEPNSQVALVNTKFNLVGGSQLNESGILEIRFGNETLNQSIQLPLKDPYVTSWEAETNTIARACNMLGLDDNFNHAFVDENVLPTIGGVAPSDIERQDEYNAGTNFFYVEGERKCYGRGVQRQINPIFQQGFNCCNTNTTQVWGTTGPNGYNLLTAGINFGGSGDNRIDFNDNTKYDTTNVGPFTQIPTAFGDDARMKQPVIGGPAVANVTTANFYNTNYASTRLVKSALDPFISIEDPAGPFNLGAQIGEQQNSEIAFNNYSLAVANPAIPAGDYDNYWGYSMSSTRCGIKQYVGSDVLNSVQELNGGGHNLPSAKDCGGYNIYCQEQIEAPVAIGQTPAPVVGVAYAGRVGLSAHCFGLNSCEFVHSAGGLVPLAPNSSFAGRQQFIQNCDLNKSTSPAVPEGAFARYIIGVRYKWKGALGSGARRLVAQAEILDPDSSMKNSFYRDVGPELDIHELSQGINTVPVGAGFNFGGNYDINVRGGPNTEAILVWRFRWTSPYQIAIEFCMTVDGVAGSYNLETDEPYLPPSASDPTAGWCKLYDMNVNDDGASGITYYINNFHNGLCFVDYPSMGGDLQFNMSKGFYDTRLSNRYKQPTSLLGLEDVIDLNILQAYYNQHYWSDNDISIWDAGGAMVSFIDDVAGTTPQRMENLTPEKFATGSGLSTKENYWLVKQIRDLPDANEWTSWYNADNDRDAYEVGFPSPFTFGVEFGLVKNTDAGVFEWNNDITGIGTPNEIYGFNATHSILPGLASLSLHYQLNNLPVLSQNGTKATTNKTFYVIDTLCLHDAGKTTPQGWYCHEVPEKLWIDLNNIGPQDLNRLEILITDDENKQITNFGAGLATSVVLCFRQKPNNTGAKRFQGGTLTNQRFDPSHTFYTQTQQPM